jgi:hypothetical protein
MDTEERLKKLERELCVEKRRTRWLLAAVVIGIVGVGLAWGLATSTPTVQAQGANIGPKVIRATQFILEDENGKTRATLEVLKNGPGLFLYDGTDKPLVSLGLSKDGPALLLHDKTGKLRAGLSVLTTGPALLLHDETDKLRVALSVHKGGPALDLVDETGKSRVGLNVDKDGPRLDLYDENARLRAALGRSELESIKTGTVEQRAESSHVLFDRSGKAIWQAP